MSNQPDDVTQQNDDVTRASLSDAVVVYCALTNLDGPNDASLLFSGLKAVQGVLRVDVF